ncbi:hypothetical protein [Neisseria sicca]|uniref:hypothetical protein n=1 Tax=Neisseria sicca TaxID=490 RepID=UPI003C74AF73
MSRKQFAVYILGYGIFWGSLLGLLFLAINFPDNHTGTAILIGSLAGSGSLWINTLVKEYFQEKIDPEILAVIMFGISVMVIVFLVFIITKPDWIMQIESMKKIIDSTKTPPCTGVSFVIAAWLTNIGIECKD